jgi:hypothetical protein
MLGLYRCCWDGGGSGACDDAFQLFMLYCRYGGDCGEYTDDPAESGYEAAFSIWATLCSILFGNSCALWPLSASSRAPGYLASYRLGVGWTISGM